MAGANNDSGAGGDFRVKDANSSNNGGDANVDGKENGYLKALLGEKLTLDSQKHPITVKLVNEEINKVHTEGRGTKKLMKFVNVNRDKPIKLSVKVEVPLKDNPKFNYIGKLLGPKGNTLKRLQDETMCKMAILGRGSIRDKDKEEQLRQSLDVKYAHLTDDLHVEISTLAPPSEAYARLAFALAEVQKQLIPDEPDDIGQGQLQPPFQGRRPALLGRPGPGRGPPRGAGGPPGGRPAPGPHALAASKQNVMSILDRARAAMANSYDDSYDESFESEQQYNNFSGAPRQGFGGGGGGGNRFQPHNFNDDEYYGDGGSNNFSENQRWKPYNKTGGGAARLEQPRFRPTPYSRGRK